MSNFDDVKTFMQTFGQEIKIKAGFPKKKIAKLRYDLIKNISTSTYYVMIYSKKNLVNFDLFS